MVRARGAVACSVLEGTTYTATWHDEGSGETAGALDTLPVLEGGLINYWFFFFFEDRHLASFLRTH